MQAACPDPGEEGGEQLLGGGEQVLAGAGPVGGQDRVAAGDEPLAGELGRGDLGEVLLVEQGQLEGAVVGHELADGGGAQGGDPPVGVRVWPRGPVVGLVQGVDAGAGDHAAVADHDHLGQPELLAHHVGDGGERGGVAGVAGEDPDRDRAAFRVGEQPVLDLQFAFLAVPGVAAGGQGALRAFQPGGRQVEQRHPGRVGSGGQVAAGQVRLDRVLPVPQPVHRGVDVIGAGIGDAEVGTQRRVVPPGQGGQLGARPDHPGDDQGQGQVPRAARRAQQRGQAQLHRGRVHGGDVPVRHRGGDLHRLLGRDQPLSLQGGLDRGYRLGWQRRQVRQRLVPDLGAVPVGAAHQDRLIHSLLSGLCRIRPLVPGYMHCSAPCRHNPDRSVICSGRIPERHA